MNEIHQLRDWLFKKRAYFSEQELADFQGERIRMKHSVSCLYINSTLSAISYFGGGFMYV